MTGRSLTRGPRACASAARTCASSCSSAVGDEAEQADREHRRHADVHAADVVGVPQDVAQPRLHRDHLGHDHGRPRDADAQAQPGEDRRQRRAEDHLGEDGALAGAQHAGGAQQQQIGVAHAVRGVDDDRIEGAEADEEQRAGVVDAEHGDGERQPRGDRHRAQELDGRIDEPGHQPVPADEQAERDADGGGEEEALKHAARGVEDGGHPRAGVRRERARGQAEDPPVPGLQPPAPARG